jgi:hypothetical protein
MYGDRVGARIGLLYYCFLSATMVVLLRENHFEGCWGSALETSGTLCAQERFTCRGGAGDSKFSIHAPIKQEPLAPPKVALDTPVLPQAQVRNLSNCGQFSISGSRESVPSRSRLYRNPALNPREYKGRYAAWKRTFASDLSQIASSFK